MTDLPAPRSRLRRTLVWALGGLLVLALLSTLGVWVAGRALPSVLGVALTDRTGATLTCGDNRTNLFLGRVDLADLVVTNEADGTGELLKVRRLLVDLDAATFLADGTRVIEEVELDLDHVRLVGGVDPMRDNNLTALVRAWQASAGPAEVATAATAPAAEAKFLIRRLRLRVGGFSLSQVLPGMPERVIRRDDRGLEFHAADVTNDNLAQTLAAPLAAAVLSSAAAASPESLLEGALRRQRK